jgi:hypothetical protein
MFLLDPASGAQRRRLIGQRASSMMRSGRNRALHEARDTMATLESNHDGRTMNEADRVLGERVRSRLGHLVRNAHAIDVLAHDGQVVLSGPVDPDRVERLIAEIGSIPGVRQVENQLQTGAPSAGEERRVNRLRRMLRRVVTPRVGAATTLSALLAAYGWSRLHGARSPEPKSPSLAGEIGF